MATLSVVVANYNHARYLPESLAAIVNQSYKPLEIIVVDDASTDQSIAIIREFQKKCPNIKLLINPHNLGACETVNRTIPIAKGDYIALCAADDIVLPHFFEKTMQVAIKHPELRIISGDVQFFCDKKPYVFTYSPKLPESNEVKLFTPAESIATFRKGAYFICSPATLYKKDLLLQFKGYKASLESLCDFYLNCKAALHFPVAYIPEPLASVRIQVANGSYGDKIRKSLGKRRRAYLSLLELVIKKEAPSFRRDFFRADLFSRTGYFLIFTLALAPKYWHYLPGLMIRVLRRKIIRKK